MSRSFLAPEVAMTVLLVAACEPALPFAGDAPEPALVIAGAKNAHAAATLDLSFAGIGGWSAVTRNGKGVQVVLHTTGLVPGNAYTVWAVISNMSTSCSDKCGYDELSNPATNAGVVYLAGNLAGARGTSTFLGQRATGDIKGSLLGMLNAPTPGLIDPLVTEWRLILRDHGPVIPGHTSAQLDTFHGGCTAGSSFGLGDGPNECDDVQFSVQLPAMH